MLMNRGRLLTSLTAGGVSVALGFFSQECNMVCAPFDGDMTFFEQLSIELLGLPLSVDAFQPLLPLKMGCQP